MTPSASLAISLCACSQSVEINTRYVDIHRKCGTYCMPTVNVDARMNAINVFDRWKKNRNRKPICSLSSAFFFFRLSSESDSSQSDNFVPSCFIHLRASVSLPRLTTFLFTFPFIYIVLFWCDRARSIWILHVQHITVRFQYFSSFCFLFEFMIIIM